jgi:predicted GNAT family acetyltransferase
MIPEILFLVEQIGPRTTQVYNLGAAISVLFQTCAFEAVKGIGDSLRVRVSDMAKRKRSREYAYLATADKAFVLVVAKRAFVTDTDEGCGADVTVAYRALAVALVAETTNGDACCLATHNQITVSLLVHASS